MSYSMTRILVEEFLNLDYFGPESKYIWEKIKNNYFVVWNSNFESNF
jgi:hypothetical protein